MGRAVTIEQEANEAKESDKKRKSQARAEGRGTKISFEELEKEENVGIQLCEGSVLGESVVFGLTRIRSASIVAMTKCNLWRADGWEA